MQRAIRTSVLIGCAIASLLGSQSVCAQEESVYSVNIVGFQQIDLAPPNQLKMASMPFEGTTTLIELFGTTTLQQGSTPLAADRIRFWDTAEQTYLSVAQATDGNFYLLDGLGWDSSFTVMNDHPIHIGEGFWLVSGGEAPAGRQIVFSGNVVEQAQFELDIVPGFQIINYPFTAELALADSNLGVTGDSTPIGADRIRVWDMEQQAYIGYALATDGQWYLLDGLSWDPSFSVTEHVFRPGEAFFYWSHTATTWVENSPYSALFE